MLYVLVRSYCFIVNCIMGDNKSQTYYMISAGVICFIVSLWKTILSGTLKNMFL